MQKHINVLVIDDDVEMRDYLGQALRSQGYEVFAAESGEQALQKIKEKKFHLVLCDLMLGKLSGIDVLESIKKSGSDAEVIMMAGGGTVESAVTAMKKGAYDFIQKPIAANEFFPLIERAIEKRELQADLAVYEASQAVFRSTKLEDLLPVIVRLALKILKADDISIMLIRDKHLEVVASYGAGVRDRKQVRIPLGERVAGKVAQGGSAVIINGPLEKDPRFTGVSSLRKINASIVYPLTINGETLGVLSANRITQTEPFLPFDMRSAAIFSSQIAQAIYNAQLYDRLERKIQEVQETQNQLVQSQKLAAIGQLAAGVAHELNNPLTAVMGFAQLVLLDPALSPQQKEDLECIHTQSQRCRRIIQDLLQFSRRSEAQKENVAVGKLLEGVVKLIHRDFSNSRIAIDQEIEKNLPMVRVDSSQMQQVFLNLANNARDAMRDAKKAKLQISAHRMDGAIRISFKDNGCGIPKNLIEKVFDPFFTTKPVGQGTGLGLSVSYGIMQEHGGTITVDSQEGVGTTFTISLPPAGDDR